MREIWSRVPWHLFICDYAFLLQGLSYDYEEGESEVKCWHVPKGLCSRSSRLVESLAVSDANSPALPLGLAGWAITARCVTSNPGCMAQRNVAQTRIHGGLPDRRYPNSVPAWSYTMPSAARQGEPLNEVGNPRLSVDGAVPSLQASERGLSA